MLKSQAEQFKAHQGRLPIPMFNDEERLPSFTITIYRCIIPLMFAVVGAIGAYYLFFDNPYCSS